MKEAMQFHIESLRQRGRACAEAKHRGVRRKLNRQGLRKIKQRMQMEGDMHTRTIAFSTKSEIDFEKWDLFFIVSRTAEASGGQAIIHYPEAFDSRKKTSVKSFKGATEEEAVGRAIAWVEKFYPTKDGWVRQEW
jgi:hypothetical protein